MAINFVRFDVAAPKAAFGQSFLEYIGKDFNGYLARCRKNKPEMSARDAYRALKNVWKRHQPPQGVKGFYAFINNAWNITLDIVPAAAYKRVWDEAMAKPSVTRHVNEFDRMDAAVDFIRNHVAELEAAYTYQLSDVRRVFCHYRGAGKDKTWRAFKASEFAAYAADKNGTEEFEDIYEVFLELR